MFFITLTLIKQLYNFNRFFNYLSCIILEYVKSSITVFSDISFHIRIQIIIYFTWLHLCCFEFINVLLSFRDTQLKKSYIIFSWTFFTVTLENKLIILLQADRSTIHVLKLASINTLRQVSQSNFQFRSSISQVLWRKNQVPLYLRPVQTQNRVPVQLVISTSRTASIPTCVICCGRPRLSEVATFTNIAIIEMDILGTRHREKFVARENFITHLRRNVWWIQKVRIHLFDVIF